MDRFDQELINAYTSIGESVDRIACFKALRAKLVSRLPADIRFENDDDLIWRLFQLRKAGKLIAKHREN